MELTYITSSIIGAAINVHKELGPGLLETIYQSCMEIELKNNNLKVESEVLLPVFYKGQRISDGGLRLDMLVEDTVIVEFKSVENVQPVHKKQLLTYLRLANRPIGLLINFNMAVLKDGISRIINNRFIPRRKEIAVATS
jgi:GxxExxY protein